MTMQDQETPVNAMPGNMMPVGQVKTNRALWKMILFTLLTGGIYSIVIFSGMGETINIVASRYDGRKTMHFCLVAFVFSWLTCGIVPLVWITKLCNRYGSELNRRGINYKFSGVDYWLWGVLGSFIIVGPFIYLYKLCKACNLVGEHYNRFG